MYLAELHGKVPSELECREDLLTSNVFSFFKYTNRQRLLGPFLAEIGISATPEELGTAEFIFWPNFEDGTQPDLVILVGRHYLLFEAKLLCDFRDCDREKDHQLLREIEGGKADAKTYMKSFSLIIITRDVCMDRERFRHILGKHYDLLRSTNWQAVSGLLQYALQDGNLDPRDRLMAEDLYELLCKGGLRSFRGFDGLNNSCPTPPPSSIFLPETAVKYGVVFAGFAPSLMQLPVIGDAGDKFFFRDGGRQPG